MKIGCIPVKPLLYTLAALGVLRSGAQFYVGRESLIGTIVPFFYLLFNGFLIVAVARRDIHFLKWAQRFTLAAAILSVIPFLIFPVLFASFIASGEWEKWDNKTHFHPDKVGNMTSPDFRFFIGTIAGLTIEAGAAFLIAVELFKYFLITRIWRSEVTLHVLSDDNFHTP
uniref:DUF805 domain-containing protein n=1 Tax=Caenorhabditis tropicalis TaxID=1561998 RepID=A0A1I7TNQ2_9PELO